MQTEHVIMDMENNPAWNAELDGYKQVIDEWAEKGYRYCGFVPVKSGPTGKLLVIDLVFQRL